VVVEGSAEAKPLIKTRIFSLLSLANIDITWGNLQKGTWKGPSICMLFKEHGEDIKHIFTTCYFTKSMLNSMRTLIGGNA
jgi:hypothetical protein